MNVWGHKCTDSRRFQNTARRFAKFPRTRAAPPFVVIVVEKEFCTQILATVNRNTCTTRPPTKIHTTSDICRVGDYSFTWFDPFSHRSLYTWKSVSSVREEFSLQYESTFESNHVIKPVVTPATTRHQLKDIDIIFPLISLDFMWVTQFGYYSLSKSSIFSKF